MKKTKKKSAVIWLCCCLLSFLFWGDEFITQTFADTSTTIHYQGRLRDRGTGELFNGSKDVTFNIREGNSSCSTLGAIKTTYVASGVGIDNGIFLVDIPIANFDDASFKFDNPPYCLEVVIDGNSLGGEPLDAVPMAINAHMVDGHHWSDIPGAGDYIENQFTSAQNPGNFWIAGSGRFGESNYTTISGTTIETTRGTVPPLQLQYTGGDVSIGASAGFDNDLDVYGTVSVIRSATGDGIDFGVADAHTISAASGDLTVKSIASGGYWFGNENNLAFLDANGHLTSVGDVVAGGQLAMRGNYLDDGSGGIGTAGNAIVDQADFATDADRLDGKHDTDFIWNYTTSGLVQPNSSFNVSGNSYVGGNLLVSGNVTAANFPQSWDETLQKDNRAMRNADLNRNSLLNVAWMGDDNASVTLRLNGSDIHDTGTGLDIYSGNDWIDLFDNVYVQKTLQANNVDASSNVGYGDIDLLLNQPNDRGNVRIGGGGENKTLYVYYADPACTGNWCQVYHQGNFPWQNWILNQQVSAQTGPGGFYISSYGRSDSYLRADGGFQVDGQTVIDSNGRFHYGTYSGVSSKFGTWNTAGFSVDATNNGDSPDLLVYENQTYVPRLYLGYNYANGYLRTYDTNENLYIDANTAGNIYLGGGSGDAGDVYVPDLIYDWDDTGYYLDPNSTSRLYYLSANAVDFSQSLTAPDYKDGVLYRYNGQAEIGVDDYLYLRDDDTNIRIRFDTNSGTAFANTFTDINDTNYFWDGSSTATSMTVAGNVGIGMTSPGTGLTFTGSMLDVNQNARIPYLYDTATTPSSGTTGQVLTRGASGILWSATPETDPQVGIVTDGRVCYGIAGNVVECNDNFAWDRTNDRLGIGTVSPGAALDIDASGTISGVHIENGDGSDTWLNYQNGNNNYIRGVTTFMDTTLDMNQHNISDGNTIYMDNWYRSSGSTGWYNQDYGVGLYAADSTWLRAYPSSKYFRAQYIYQDGPVGYASSIDGTLTSGYIPRADGSYRIETGSIFDNGNIGIGTTSPGTGLTFTGSMLDVNQNARIPYLYDTAGSSGTTGQVLTRGASGTLWGMSSETDPQVGTVTDGRVCYGIGGNVVECNDSFAWDRTNDRLGIGTMGPTQSLDVNGNATANLYYDRNDTAYYLDPNGVSKLNYLHIATNDTWIPYTGNDQNYIRGVINTNNAIVAEGYGTIRDANGGWVRTYGNTGWKSETYDGGWYMTDSSWLRTYNAKSVWTSSGLLGSDGGLTVGYGGVAPSSGGAIISGKVGIGDSSPDATLDVEGTIYATAYGRDSHSEGHLVGSYNSVGANSTYSNPIYTIGSSYNPSDSSLGNMYGIGYSHDNFWYNLLGVGRSDAGWGMYVAADGDIRATLSGTNGDLWSTGELYMQGTGNNYLAGRLGIGTDAPTASLHVTGGTYDGTPNINGTQIGSGVIEMTLNGGAPFIDFQNDTVGTDFDARIRLMSDYVLGIYGTDLSLNDKYLLDTRAIQLKDWDDDSGGQDNKYRVLARDGAWMFYNGGVVIGGYGNGTWSDVADGYLIVKNRVGVNKTSPGGLLDVSMGNNNDYFRVNDDGNIGLELKSGSSGGQPYIDFANDTGDFDVRLWRTADNTLSLWGGNLALMQMDTGSEGGEIFWDGAGSYTDWYTDIWQNMFRWHHDGDVEMKLYDYGDLYIDGAYHCSGADVAEITPAVEPLEAGEVVSLDESNEGKLRRSQTAYEKNVAGVVSTNPGVLLNHSEDQQAASEANLVELDGIPLALAGRVTVRVTTENGAIHVGDLLVTSSTPGYAMRGDSQIILDTPGVVLGKAMGSIEEGEGEILVLVSLR